MRKKLITKIAEYAGNSYFEASLQKINVKENEELIFFDRAWAIEVRPRFGFDFCIGVYDSRFYNRIVFAQSLDVSNDYRKEENQDCIFYDIVVETKNFQDPVIVELSKINLFLEPYRSHMEDAVFFEGGRAKYTFRISLTNENIDLSFQDELKYKNLLISCSSVAKILASKCNIDKIRNTVDEWVKEIEELDG